MENITVSQFNSHAVEIYSLQQSAIAFNSRLLMPQLCLLSYCTYLAALFVLTNLHSFLSDYQDAVTIRTHRNPMIESLD